MHHSHFHETIQGSFFLSSFHILSKFGLFSLIFTVHAHIISCFHQRWQGPSSPLPLPAGFSSLWNKPGFLTPYERYIAAMFVTVYACIYSISLSLSLYIYIYTYLSKWPPPNWMQQTLAKNQRDLRSGKQTLQEFIETIPCPGKSCLANACWCRIDFWQLLFSTQQSQGHFAFTNK